ncbi:MAG: aspartate aminotransferase family protein [Clostridia bacterium]|jgi:putrescine aminotransferase|nr:aspartate aminotransferase family protein [Clostridia bacterium]
MKLISLEEATRFNRQEIREYYSRYVNPSLAKVVSLLDFDKQFVQAENFTVRDADGQEYLDFLGGYGALNLGHNPPAVLEAVQTVAWRPNLLQASLNPLAAALGHNLTQILPGDLGRVFFCNSGAEAVEAALKIARAYRPDKRKIIYCTGSFHGKTFGALSVSGRDKYKAPFAPLLPDCAAVDFGDLNALEQKLAAQDTAAFIVEPIQGEGGVIVPPAGYLAGVRELCSRYGVLLIADEIQTGFGRTGRLFACEHEHVVPDILCAAKSLGGGIFPLGACITLPHIWDAVYGGLEKYALHTSTFGGNTFAMAAGIAALQEITGKDLANQAEIKGTYLLEKIKALPDKHHLLKEVRGQGLLIGLEFNQPVSGLLDKLSFGRIARAADEYFATLVAGELLNKYHIITAYTLNNPQVIRLEPPLTVSREALDKVVSALGEILEKSFARVTVDSIGSAVLNKLKH